MRASLPEVLERSRRHNQEEEYRLYPVVARVGKLVSWLLINLGVSANQTTAGFFVAATASAALFTAGTRAFVAAAFALYWLHVILDFSDGDIARFHQRFARNGEFWDHVVHLFTIPLVTAGIVLGEARQGADLAVIGFGLLLVTTTGFNRGLRDVVRLVKPPSEDDPPSPSESPGHGLSRLGKLHWLARLFTTSAFVNVYTAATLFSADGPWSERAIIVYSLLALTRAGAKLLAIQRIGSLPGRSTVGPQRHP